MKTITVRWDRERSAYFVSEPCWDGGDVYLASDVDVRITELEKALREIMTFQPGHFRPLEDEIKIYEIAKAALGL